LKIALCTTTIHVPHALKLMRKCSADVKFFVAGDEKSPHTNIITAQTGIGNYDYLMPGSQKKWNCSEVIGWNTLARRNIAFLEALKWGADAIYSWDNDNLPVGTAHFYGIEQRLATKFNGIKVASDTGWFDPGSLLIPAVRHRGFPHNKPVSKMASPVIDAHVGVAAGLVIGDPDIDATTRIERAPDVTNVHILGSTGVIVDHSTWTVFNSQNTAVIRDLMPAWFMMPGVGRHDDIYASLIVQRVARERHLHVHFGLPFTYQQRNAHNLVSDIRKEIDGMENVQKLAEFLDSIILPARSVIEDTRIIYGALLSSGLISIAAVSAGLAWLEDVETVL